MNQKWYHRSAVRADEVKVVGPEGRQCYCIDSNPEQPALMPTNMKFGDTMEVGDFIILQRDPDYLVPEEVCEWVKRKEFLKYYNQKA